METIKFKTDIKCSGCIAKVTPFLNEIPGVENWEANVTDPAKVLTVTGTASETEVKEAVAKAGFKAERI
jgi:copper chaperone